MSLYKTFQTDSNLEKTGVVLLYGKNSKGKDIEIRIARAGGSNAQYHKLMEVKTKPYRRQIQNETMENDVAERITKEVYAQSVILGWEGVEDENNKPMEFTFDNCMKLFNDLPELWKDIQEQATKSALFRAHIMEVDAKN